MESPTTTEEDDQREATQLQEYDHATTLVPNGAMASSAVVSNPAANRKHGRIQSMQTSLQNFWERQVSATVLHDACRDHFALERTFLGYLRTSLALSFLAVIIAQFFRLQHSESPDQVLGYYVLGIPLAAVCIVAAIIVLLLGALRFWRQQNAILRGKVHAGGLELNSIGLVILLVILALFVLTVTIDSRMNS